MKKPYYISTAITYTSGKPHIGNIYEIILADSIARYHRLIGDDVYFQTGTDEHGQKTEDKAKEAGVDTQKFVDSIVELIQAQEKIVNVEYDKFVRTTDSYHKLQVQKMFKKFYEQGDIYKGEYEGLYCKPCESFYTESQLVDGKCPDCGREVTQEKEEAYFFKMSKYQDRLIQHIKDNPYFIQPESRKNEMLNNFLLPGLQDLCVSRTSFKWGIPVDFDPDHVVYVWIDALSNYITGIGYDVDGNNDEMFNKYWPADVHLIGKDILRFHTIYWPIMLMALDIELPKQVFGHPWLMMGDGKMSKSKGNVIYADDLVALFGVDGVRYFVLKETPFSNDGSITYELLCERINNDLANILGNLVNRTLIMSNKYLEGKVINTKVNEDIDLEIGNLALTTKDKVVELMAELKVADAIGEIMNLVRRLNKYVDESEPWLLGKDETKKDRLNTVLYTLLEGVRYSAILLSPFIPQTSLNILDQLQTKKRNFDSLLDFGNLESPIIVTSKPTILFERIDSEKLLQGLNKETKEENRIPIDDFNKLDIKIGKVLSCEKHPSADKLLISQIDIGAKTIQVVSGIANYYQPEEMIGKKLVVITNLLEVKIRDVISQGMILVAKNEESMELLEVEDAKVGDLVK